MKFKKKVVGKHLYDTYLNIPTDLPTPNPNSTNRQARTNRKNHNTLQIPSPIYFSNSNDKDMDPLIKKFTKMKNKQVSTPNNSSLARKEIANIMLKMSDDIQNLPLDSQKGGGFEASFGNKPSKTPKNLRPLFSPQPKYQAKPLPHLHTLGAQRQEYKMADFAWFREEMEKRGGEI